MSTPAPAMPDPRDDAPVTARNGWRRVLRELINAPFSAKLGLLIIAVYVFVAIFAPWLAPYGESEIVGKKYMVWDEDFLLGTDNLGRDMLTRLIYGARNTVGIALVTTIYAFILGGILGIIAAVLGGCQSRRFPWITESVSYRVPSRSS